MTNSGNLPLFPVTLGGKISAATSGLASAKQEYWDLIMFIYRLNVDYLFEITVVHLLY